LLTLAPALAITLAAGSHAIAGNVAANRTVRRQVKLIKKTPGAQAEFRTINDRPTLHLNNQKFGDAETFRSANLALSGQHSSTLTDRGTQKWYSQAGPNLTIKEHAFVLSRRNTKLRQLGFRPGEEVTVQTQVKNGRVTKTASTVRASRSKRPYKTYKRKLPND